MTDRLAVVLAGLFGALALGPSAASAQELAIPEENGAVIARIFGVGEDLAGCRFTGGGVERVEGHAEYECPEGIVAVTLRHRDAPGSSVHGRDFGFSSEPPAPELLAALVERADREDDPWIVVGTPPIGADVQDVAGLGSSPESHALIILAGAALFGVGWWLARRRTS